MQMQNYSNPIIKGFNPDPSICRVKNDFFLVTSSFEFFPGVPIYKSTNLVNWSCIGHCLTRKSQLFLENCKASEGIYAPTIRYYNGKFYMVTTNVSDKGNLIVSTEDIYGEWSEPVWIDQRGIDPSLLFADGKVYFISNADEHGNSGIYMCEINPDTGEKFSRSCLISKGCGGKYPEAPHVYKRNGLYYLMLAEGGTEYGHMVTIQRSENPYGPYEPCPHNPILSHRALENMDISCVGHADLTEDQWGNWWLVALGTRSISYDERKPMLHNLGRETFLAPVKWQNDWPIVGDHGTLALKTKAELPAEISESPMVNAWTFQSLAASHAFSYIRNPDVTGYEFHTEQNRLILHGTSVTLSEEGKSPTFIGLRQTEFSMTASVRVTPQIDNDNGKVGFSIYYNHEHHYDFYIRRQEHHYYAALRKQVYDIEAVTAERELKQTDSYLLKIEADSEYYRFYLEEDGQETLLEQGTTAALCTEITRRMTFTGTFIGLFAEYAAAQFDDLKITFY